MRSGWIRAKLFLFFVELSCHVRASSGDHFSTLTLPKFTANSYAITALRGFKLQGSQPCVRNIELMSLQAGYEENTCGSFKCLHSGDFAFRRRGTFRIILSVQSLMSGHRYLDENHGKTARLSRRTKAKAFRCAHIARGVTQACRRSEHEQSPERL